MKKLLIISALFLMGGSAMAQINLNRVKGALGSEQLSREEVGNGIKEALSNGVSKGTDMVSQTDGFFKNPEIRIPFPPEVAQVETRLRQAGMGAKVDEFILSLNRAAEDASKEAKPIFLSAIRQLSIQDAFSLLRGDQDAATQFLSRTTTPQLHDAFRPIVKSSLDKVNATRLYADLINSYNKIPLVQRVNPELDSYATNKAIEGLFVMVAKEERNIRQNPAARTSDTLRKVFGNQ